MYSYRFLIFICNNITEIVKYIEVLVDGKVYVYTMYTVNSFYLIIEFCSCNWRCKINTTVLLYYRILNNIEFVPCKNTSIVWHLVEVDDQHFFFRWEEPCSFSWKALQAYSLRAAPKKDHSTLSTLKNGDDYSGGWTMNPEFYRNEHKTLLYMYGTLDNKQHVRK